MVTARHLEPIQQIIRDVGADVGTDLAEFNGEASHVHLLMNFPTTGGAPISVLRHHTERQDHPRLTPAGVRPLSPPA